ncbi:DUF2382 domain-containing protein [Botryobacter ruber]|uniref:DUF2382 domain-containing protein n=1 Tax=Botryobacter ruber TaxID=2171629 RepID=UPI001F0CDA15|nr:PRC and DUF2382 domain-containing protein [Botryobacter ruber]
MDTNKEYNRENLLLELGGSSYEVVEGQPDIRGWTVKNDLGQTVGEVEDLLIDPQALKVRYIVLDLEGNVLDLEPRDVLVPIGLAELHESDDEVFIPRVTPDQLASLPEYHSGTFSSSIEASVRNVFAGVGSADLNDRTGYYNHEHFSEENLYRRRNTPPPAAGTTDTSGTIPVVEENLNVGKRTVETGGAIIRSKVEERPVEENINLREEHVNIERNPVNRPATGADMANFKEGEIEITEHAEVPVVEKEARVVEEITIDKEVEEHDETIRDTVRKTDVDIDDLDRRDLDRDRNTDRDRNNPDRDSPRAMP